MISIIVPVYNVDKYLDSFFSSLDSQTRNDFEVIFIDDGSSDDSLKKIQEYSFSRKNVTFYSQTNSGVGAARNLGLYAAKGEYVYFADPDDIVYSDFVEVITGASQDFSPEMIIFSFYKVNNGERAIKGNNELNFLSNRNKIIEFFPSLIKYNNIYAPWNKVYKKSLLTNNTIEFPSQITGQDSLFNLHVFEIVQNLLVLPNTLYQYTVYRSNSAQTKINFSKIDDDINIINAFEKTCNEMGINSDLISNLIVQKVFKALKHLLDHSNSKNKDLNLFFNKNNIHEAISKIDNKALGDVKFRIKRICINVLNSFFYKD
ncbi:MAG TPA: hypothetical protein DIW15_04575 [Bavariicoccus seileri]|uniref:Glycosyltransferase 2-like domain-containing protein n=1 Tax=Bavariicoccus seileri TaxID=549685 RepID=A0A3D4S548_9ENTE|nr:glycosyltransferase [Bavariicoccus seileri]HCS93965.1 hypothetical protein [Bavariicoccus seileri]